MTDFSYEVEMTVRYRDLDPQGHVNNAVCASYLEHARTGYLSELLGDEIGEPGEVGIVVANLELDYRRPIEFRAPVTVALRTTDIGESSLRTAYEIRADGDVAVTAESTMVAVDESGSPRQLPARLRERIADYDGI